MREGDFTFEERQELRLAVRAALAGPAISGSSRAVLEVAYAKLAIADCIRAKVPSVGPASFASIGDLANDVVDRLASAVVEERDRIASTASELETAFGHLTERA
jgi:hypothetical protein